MSNFIPTVGDAFYMRCRPREIISEDVFGNTTVRQQQDYSYSDVIFQCVAVDDTHFVAKRLTSSVFKEPQLFRKSDYIYTPVGPSILAALGITL